MKNNKIIWIIGMVALLLLLSQGGKEMKKQGISTQISNPNEDNASFEIYTGNAVGQTFIAPSDFTITSIRLMTQPNWDYSNLYIEIQDMQDNLISSGELTWQTQMPQTKDVREVPLQEAQLNAGQEYIFYVASWGNVTAGQKTRVWRDEGDPYPYGYAIDNAWWDGGEPGEPYPNSDLYFVIMGDSGDACPTYNDFITAKDSFIYCT